MRNKTILFLLIILAIAIFFRLWQLDKIPPGLYPDEAINGNEAITNPGQMFYPENNGREGLFINLISSSFSFFGISAWSLRLVSAIIGILTVFGLYLLTKELLSFKPHATNIALLSSFFLATSFWHTNFSRIGFRAILVPFILVFSFYFLLKGFRKQKVLNLIIAGAIFGLGFYSYTVFRLAVLLLIAALFLWMFIYQKKNLGKKFLIFAFCSLFFVLIVALPVGIYFLKNPQYFISRATGVSVFSQDNPIKAFGISLISHLGMFNFFGDFNWRHNISGSPQLFWPIGVLFLIGFVLSIKDLFLIKKEKNYSTFPVSCFILSWLFITLLPSTLTYEGVPHSLRSIGVIPVAFIFAGIGGEFLWRKIKTRVNANKLLIFTVILFFFSLLFAQYWRYFIIWGENIKTENAFSKNYVAIGNYLNSLPPETQKYVIVNKSGVPIPWPDGIPVTAQTIMFTENTKYESLQATYLLSENLDKIKVNENPTVIILMDYEQNIFEQLQIMFPEGSIQEENGILIYKI